MMPTNAKDKDEQEMIRHLQFSGKNQDFPQYWRGTESYLRQKGLWTAVTIYDAEEYALHKFEQEEADQERYTGSVNSLMERLKALKPQEPSKTPALSTRSHDRDDDEEQKAAEKHQAALSPGAPLKAVKSKTTTEGLAHYLLLKDNKPNDANVVKAQGYLREHRELDLKAYHYFSQTLSKGTASTKLDHESLSARETVRRLLEAFRSSTTTRAFILLNEMYALARQDVPAIDSSLFNIVDRVRDLNSQLHECGIRLEPFLLISILKNHIPDDHRWSHLTPYFESISPRDPISTQFETVAAKVIARETELRHQDANNGYNSRAAAAREYNGGGGSGSGRDERSNRGRDSRECHYCHKVGHIARDCRKKKADEAQHLPEGKEESPHDKGKQNAAQTQRSARSIRPSPAT